MSRYDRLVQAASGLHQDMLAHAEEVAAPVEAAALRHAISLAGQVGSILTGLRRQQFQNGQLAKWESGELINSTHAMKQRELEARVKELENLLQEALDREALRQ